MTNRVAADPERLLPTSAAAPAGVETRRAGTLDEMWLIYLSNGLTMIAVSMFVRYADFVSLVGGGEAQLGLIVGVGMVGSLVMRLAQGVGIDRYGSRRIWLGSLAVYVASVLAHQFITSAFGPGIFLVRLAMQTALAGIFGASITFVSRLVPPQRVAEMVGTVGISGFVGMLIGPQLADWICGHGLVGHAELNRLFQVAGLIALLAMAAASLATRRESPPRFRPSKHVFDVFRQYRPGLILAVAIAAGTGLNLPFTFLRTFAAERGLTSIGIFFSFYSVVAIVVRLLTRNLFERYGNRPWVIVGMVLLIASLGCYLLVSHPWQWLLPGVLAGIAHALLFPSVVAAGSTVFPDQYRGLGTTLMLAMFDFGNLLGSPLVGGLLHGARSLHFPAYPTMLLIVGALMAGIAAAYVIADRHRERTPALPSVPDEAGEG